MSNIFSRFWDSLTDALGNIWDAGMDFLSDIAEFTFNTLGFHDQDVYQVANSISRVLADETTSLTERMLVQSVLDNNDDLAGLLYRDSMVGTYASVGRYLEYGRTEFYHRLPSSVGFYHESKVNIISDLLASILGAPVTIEHVQLTGVPEEIWIYDWLLKNDTYTYINNVGILTYAGETYPDMVYVAEVGGYQLTFSRDETERFELISRIITTTTLGQTTKHYSTFVNVYNAADILLRVEDYVEDEKTTADRGEPDSVVQTTISITYVENIVTYEYPVLIPLMDMDAPWYYLRYHFDATQFNTHIWLYNRNDGTYPELDSASPQTGGLYGTDTSQILPIVPLRKDFADIAGAEGIIVDVAYPSSKAMLDLIGVDIDNVIDSYQGSGDLDKISDVAILFATNIYSETQGAAQMFYNLFTVLYVAQDVTYNDYVAWPETSSIPPNIFSIEEDSFNTILQYNWITTNSIAGVIGDIDFCTSEHQILPATTRAVYTWDVTGGEYVDDVVQTSKWVIRKQISLTHFSEIIVSGLTLITAIATTANTVKALRVFQSNDASDRAISVIPLSYATLDDMRRDERAEVLHESLILSVYASEHTHLRYYETPTFLGIFSFVIQIIAIVVLIGSFGKGVKISTWLIAFAESLLFNYALLSIVEELMSHNISDEAKIALVALAAYASFKFGGRGLKDPMPFADTLLLAVNSIASSISTVINIDTANLQEDLNDLQEMYDSILADYEDASELVTVEGQGVLSLEGVRHIFTSNPYEYPDQFYNRTVETNPGVLALDAIEDYADQALMLPEHIRGLAAT